MVFIRNASTILANCIKNTVLFFFIGFISCGSNSKLSSQISTTVDDSFNDPLEEHRNIVQPPTVQDTLNQSKPIIVGANQMELYLPLLIGKNVAIVGNQTSVIFKNPDTRSSLDTENITSDHIAQYTHLVDSLIFHAIKIDKVFAPEHGFRGKKDAAELVVDGKDKKTGLSIVSLYGKDKKPTAAALKNIDILIFDIQDVGVRFYTYISTLHYVMQACAENKIPMLLLDRPNPNGHSIDGPTLEPAHSSFVGMHPIPLVHGMTIGEYAKMINGEGWLENSLICEITIIPVKNYDHQTVYSLPIRPSPNLPNDKAINLYPSLGLFEGTTVNAGRGTEMQFQIFGSPDFPIESYDFAYTPQSNFGAKYPKHQGELCYGKDLRNTPTLTSLNLQWLVDAYKNCKNKDTFFKTSSFTVHAGTEKLQQQIIQGLPFEDIKNTWLEDLEKFKITRARYLLYP